jgi:hypothetical protein
VLGFILASLVAARAQAPVLSPGQLRTLPDQAQVRVLGWVTQVDPRGRSVRVEANGMTFTAEGSNSARIPQVRPGDRVLVTGELQPGGKILLDTLEPVRPSESIHSLIGTLLSLNQRRRRLVLKSDTGRRVQINYGPDTTFVRLGRRSRAGELRFGDRVWVDRAAGGSPAGAASRVEVVDARKRRFDDVGESTAVDSARQQLRVRFSTGARTILMAQSGVRGASPASRFHSLKVGLRIRVVGDERRGVIIAERVEPIRSER